MTSRVVPAPVNGGSRRQTTAARSWNGKLSRMPPAESRSVARISDASSASGGRLVQPRRAGRRGALSARAAAAEAARTLRRPGPLDDQAAGPVDAHPRERMPGSVGCRRAPGAGRRRWWWRATRPRPVPTTTSSPRRRRRRQALPTSPPRRPRSALPTADPPPAEPVGEDDRRGGSDCAVRDRHHEGRDLQPPVHVAALLS